ncbi:hypothetical protein RhiirA5_414298 [Rhizophagus irregularis]|uniref:Uncharacterized protein n=1 Tax=Rhizophagus irregularis TaxID=588596 RepID=A0A2N0PUF6_9GLOM|nr:hypothetical protein RhiirA5_414298 [Rhizophagus irregularis]
MESKFWSELITKGHLVEIKSWEKKDGKYVFGDLIFSTAKEFESDDKLKEVALKILDMLKTFENAIITTFERQSIASSDRKGDGRERQPDIMLVTNESDKLYELMYVECS